MISRRNAIGIACSTGVALAMASRFPLTDSGAAPLPVATPVPKLDRTVLLGPEAWSVQTGGGGWGNGELQRYTAGAVQFADDGALSITAEVSGSGADATCTSGRITTGGRFSFTEGTVTARLRLPEGQGLLPAFWLLGDSLADVGWPACGEIDVVETPNTTRHSVHSLHGPKADRRTPWHLNRGIDRRTPLARDFHDFAVQRRRGRVVLLLDGDVVLDRRRSQLRKGRWVFDEPFHLVLSLAVGGEWPGPPDRTTPRRSVLDVAWVRYEPDLLPD